MGAIKDIFIRRGILPNPKRQNKRAGISYAEISKRNTTTK